MELAARHGIPIVCMIDTPGAYPGIGAEERGQAYQIALNLREMAMLSTLIICVVIGEGGSGGALGIGVADRVLMFDNHLHQGERSVSRVIEVAFDPSNGTATTMWEFTQPNLGFTPWMGDARRLPGGNTLVAFTLTGRLYEVTPQGEVVWEAQAPEGMPVTRIHFATDLYDLNAP